MKPNLQFTLGDSKNRKKFSLSNGLSLSVIEAFNANSIESFLGDGMGVRFITTT